MRSNLLKKVFEQVEPATQTVDGRTPVEKTIRPLLRQIANPLLLGEMGADSSYFVLGQHWKTHFSLKAASVGGAMTVGQMRKWMDEPKPMGLSKDAQNLVILMFAAQTNKTFFLHGGPYEPTLSTIDDRSELRNIDLPQKESWEPAVERANGLFGVNVSALLSTSNVGLLTSSVKKKAADTRKAIQAYCQRLKEGMARLSISEQESDRLKTAEATRKLVDQICGAESGGVVDLLAQATIATSETAMAECVGRAAELDGNLEAISWDLFNAMSNFDYQDERWKSAQKILEETKLAIVSDEHAVQLAATLKGQQAKAVSLLAKPQPPVDVEKTIPSRTDPPVVVVKKSAGKTIVEEGDDQNLSIQDAKALISKLDKKLQPGDVARLNISWIIEGERTKP